MKRKEQEWGEETKTKKGGGFFKISFFFFVLFFLSRNFCSLYFFHPGRKNECGVQCVSSVLQFQRRNPRDESEDDVEKAERI